MSQKANTIENTENIVNVGPLYNGNSPTVGRAKRYPPSRKIKQAKKNLLKTRKLKQKSRNLHRRRAREGKASERELEANNEYNLGYKYFQDNEQLQRFLMNEEMRYQQEQERLEQTAREEEEKRRIQKAMKAMEELEKNRFYIRVDLEKKPFKASFIERLFSKRWFNFRNMEILYLSKNPAESYFKHIFFSSEYDIDGNNSLGSFGNYLQNGILRSGWKVYDRDIVDFFVPPVRYYTNYFPNYSPNYEWNEDYNNEQEYGKFEGFYENKKSLYKYIRGLPHFMEKAEAERKAQFTAPGKLESLQLKGLEETIKPFEKRTGKTVPRDVKNIIESYIMKRKPLPTYFEERNNIFKIDPTLFQGGKQRTLKKKD